MKARQLTPEHREKIAAAKRGVPRPASVRLKLSATKTGVPNMKLRGRKKTPEHCANIAAAKRGMPSPKRGIPISEYQKEKLLLANLGKTHSDEHKAKISAGLLLAYASGRRPRLRPGTQQIVVTTS